MFKSLLQKLDLVKFWKQFKLKQKLGQGGYGKVYLVSRKTDQKMMAVKCLKKTKISHFAQSSSGVAPLEVYCLKTLRHEHIIRAHGFLETKFHWMITMEYISTSMDLFDFVESKHRLCEMLARDIFIQVQSAVTYCFSMGIDHRDIKDENILIDTATNRIKLIDFGAASVCDKDAPYTTGRGTEIFLPAEFFSRGYYYAIEGTMWALGCLVYKMVMGHYPFFNSDEVQILQPRVAKVSPMCRSFIRMSLSKDPTERLQYKNILRHSWFSVDKRHL